MSTVYNRKHNENTKGSNDEPLVQVSHSLSHINEVNIVFGLVIFRICNVFLVQTWFVPDEFWQGPEVAHHMVFHYGYLTWEWLHALRGYSFPSLFAILFKCLQLLNLDYAILLVYLPRIFQAILTSIGDFHIYKLAKLVCTPGAQWWVLVCHMTSWFWFYTCTRTLTNTTETVLISIALYYWEHSCKADYRTNMYTSLMFAAFSCLVRPTALILWLPLAVMKLYNAESRMKFLVHFIAPIGCIALFLSIILDSYFYNRLVVVQYNFLYYNIIQNVADFYGTHPWHWYFSQGVPVVIGTHLLPFALGIKYSAKLLSKWLFLIFLYIVVHSLLGHKEFRFILPILPLFMVVSGEGLHQLSQYDDHKKIEDAPKSKSFQSTFGGKLLVIFLLITNIPVALYTGICHQRGTMDVMYFIQTEVSHNDNMNVLFLMPCHSTPYYSVIHQNISMRFLDCSPSNKADYVDEAEQFYKQPTRWLSKTFDNVENNKDLPSHIIMFDVLVQEINHFLINHNYKMCRQFFHTHFPSVRIGSKVMVFCKQ